MRPEVRRTLGQVRRRALGDGQSPSAARRDDRSLILRSGLFDQSWVEAQLDRTFASVEDAVDAYLDSATCTPHPLFLPDWIDARPEAKEELAASGADPLLWYLRDALVRRNASTHPLLNTATIADLAPQYVDPPLGRVVAWLADATPETPMPGNHEAPRITLGEVVELSYAALRDWAAGVAIRDAPRTSRRPPATTVTPHGPALSGPGDTPLVSIVMPMWNRASVVRSAIESVQAQTHTDWELVVVDDGSDDDSRAVVAGLAAFDERITCVRAEHGGVSRARNIALARARGTYVAFLDTDNRWRPDFLHVMLTEMSAQGWTLAHSALRAEKDGTEYFRAFEGTYEQLLVGNHVDLNVLVVRRDTLTSVGGFDESLRRGVDYDLVLRLAREHDLHLVPYVGIDYRDDDLGGARISTVESIEWLSVITSRHLVDWPAVASAQRTPGRTSVVLPLRATLRVTLRWLYELADDPSRDDDLEVVVVGIRLPMWQHVVTSVICHAVGNARLVSLHASRGPATAANLGFSTTTGDRTVLVLGHTEPDRAALLDLSGALDDPEIAVVQPLMIGADDVVVSAGAVFGTSTARPEPFLRQHPVSDAVRAGHRPVPAALGPVVAVRSQALATLGGLDALYGDQLAETDLSLRVHRAGMGRTELWTSSKLVTRAPVMPIEPARLEAALRVFDERFTAPPPGSDQAWAGAGFEVVGRRLLIVGDARPGPLETPMLAPRTLVRPLRAAAITESAPSLRWTIDLAARSGHRGKGWGDLHFGEALANALRRRGQHVSVDPREARHRPTRSLDDVIVVLRGLDRVAPRPECLNISWIISHPDLVSAAEIAPFDLVYAASVGWSAEVSDTWGVAVKPLLQATDPTMFHPARASFDTGSDVLFVGNSRGVHRTSLQAALAARADVTVHGRGWHDVLDAGIVASQRVDNAELGCLYTAAGVVLNDHWEDMRLMGFVSNRLMDATASGARVISDPIPGLDLTEMFHGLVHTFESVADMARLIAGKAEIFPGPDERLAAAAAVSAEHSFDARAEVLLDDAVGLLRARTR